MIGDSKILTVSYGAFSCTLEGFDDPFNSMKAIAEYFRDLAADDRYFGAEPPTPDAAMLHRIAEREVQRMVEVRVQDSSVVLRQQDAPSAPTLAPQPTAYAPTAEAPAFTGPFVEAVRVAPPEPAATQPETAPAEVPVQADPVQETTPPMPALADAMPDGVVAKLARLRQSVMPDPVAGPEPVEADEDIAEPMLADATVDLPEATESHVETFDEAPVEATAVEDTAVEEASLEEAASAGLTVEDRASDEAASDPAAEDLTSDEAAPEDFSFSDLTAVDPTPEDIAAEAEAAADEAGVDEVLDRLGLLLIDPVTDAGNDDSEAPHIEVDATEVTADQPADDAASFEDTLSQILMQVGTSEPEAAAEPVAETTAELDEDDELEAVASDEMEAAASEPASDAEVASDLTAKVASEAADEIAAEATPDATAEPAPQVAPLILSAALLQSDPEPVAETTPDAEDEAATEDEPAAPNDLRAKRTLARVIRIRRSDADAEDTTADVDPSRPLDEAGEDAAMARLLRQADDEMADADNQRRLSAIAHLKAAVAATEAERIVTGEAMSNAPKIEPYREDLAQVVQPMKPEPSVPQTPMPIRPRRDIISVKPDRAIVPAPLVLVSEQRIDRTPPTGQPMVAVRPAGRLSAAIGASAAQQAALARDTDDSLADEDDADDDTDNIFSDEAGFVEFAAKLGVKSLPDLLEAAAAYATCVENRASFTRPQLMRRLTAAATGREVTREDGLRSFGTLLRSGRIEKLRRGQYALAETSPYLAEAKRMAL